MSLAFLAPSRTVLLMSDEALYIYATSAKAVRLVEIVPWDAENFESNVANIISKDCGAKPVLILNDMVEQHYRKERLIRRGVNVMDKPGMLKRKLNAAFPSYPVKAAYPLKEKLPKSDKSPPADIYIFAAVPASNQFGKTLSAARESLASIAGFCLLPVESSDMLKALSAKISKKKKGASTWTVFMGQHKNGGLRQIVTKNGELALTRMTPIIDSESDAGQWAQEAHQEFKATMSYLSRFGYQPSDGLDVIVIANSALGDAFEALVEEDCNFVALSVTEAARMLGVPVGRQDNARYADPLHAAWAGRKAKFILPMKAAQIDQVSKPRQAAMAATLVLFCGAAFLGYQMFSNFQTISSLHSDIEDSRTQFAHLDVQYQKEVQRKEELGFDVLLMQSSIQVQDQLERKRFKTLELFDRIGKAKGRDLRLDKITVKKPDSNIVTTFVNAMGNTGPALYEANMQMTYPSTTDIEKGNQEVRDFRGRLATLLSGNTVEVTKLLKDYEYVEEMVVETGDVQTEGVKQDFVAEITIKGPPEEQGAPAP
jgi:hypothetical protein